jgi:SAM-dependent methyltransferase
LHAIDASEVALTVARDNLCKVPNVSFHHNSLDTVGLPDGSLDFAYSLGVMHHVPDTAGAVASVARKLKRGAPLLVYIYYAFDNRPWWFRMLWRTTDAGRRVICRLPVRMRYLVCDFIALTVYWPLARVARLLESARIMPKTWPLAWYRDRALYVMRTDALDRFGTRLEQRFSREQI